MTDQDAEKPKRSFNIVGLLRTIAIILAVIVFLATAITNLLMVYIIFAPDDAPKPFYLVSYLPGQLPQVPVSGESTPAGEGGEPGNTSGNKSGTPVPGAEGQNTPVEQVMPGTGVLLDTGTKIVNLADPSKTTYLRAGVVLEFAPNSEDYFNETPVPSAGEGAKVETVKEVYTTSFKDELNTRLPVINDAINTLLSTKKFDQIYTSEGKEALRQELMQAINSRLPSYKVIQVYFTEFVVQ